MFKIIMNEISFNRNLPHSSHKSVDRWFVINASFHKKKSRILYVQLVLRLLPACAAHRYNMIPSTMTLKLYLPTVWHNVITLLCRRPCVSPMSDSAVRDIQREKKSGKFELWWLYPDSRRPFPDSTWPILVHPLCGCM